MALFRKIARSWQKPTRTEELNWILSTGIFFFISHNKSQTVRRLCCVEYFRLLHGLLSYWKMKIVPCGDTESNIRTVYCWFGIYFYFFYFFFKWLTAFLFYFFLYVKNFISVQQLFKPATDKNTCLKPLWHEFFQNVTKSKTCYVD